MEINNRVATHGYKLDGVFLSELEHRTMSKCPSRMQHVIILPDASIIEYPFHFSGHDPGTLGISTVRAEIFSCLKESVY